MKKVNLETAMLVSFMTALIATLGSLYFSEVLHYIPCEYCWFQRIFMYPLVIVLGMAVARKEYGTSIYVLPLSVIGLGFSVFHILIQHVPALHDTGAKCGIVPCYIDYLNWFGFITIPVLAGTAFLIISVMQFVVWRAVKQNAK
jgi:disulfide bond formation protein DsbB